MRMAKPHLLTEDRPEFERLLDEVLRTADEQPGLTTLGEHLTAEQLRTMALNDRPAIAARAATEYRRYVRARRAWRTPVRSAGAAARAAATARGRRPSDLPTKPDEVAEAAAGAGLVAVLIVLAPVLAGAAAVVFLIAGYLLRALDSGSASGGSMVTIGWVLALCTAVGILLAAATLLSTAVRNGSTTSLDDEAGWPAELVRARDAWRAALRDRGLLPFLHTRLAMAARSPVNSPTALPEADRLDSDGPEPSWSGLGYSAPGFSSPDSDPESDWQPDYSSPDYGSPDYGGTRQRRGD